MTGSPAAGGPWAHSPDPSIPQREWHSWLDHARGTAERASEFAAAFGMGDAGRWLGLWHDLGKLDPEWQQYLFASAAGDRPRGTGPDHKAAGAIRAGYDADGAFADMLQLALLGHHGGLPATDRVDTILGDEYERRADGLDAAWRKAKELLSPARPAERLALPAAAGTPARRDLAVRMLFSCLADADRLDTEAYRDPGKSRRRDYADPGMAELWSRFRASQKDMLATPSDASEEVLRARRSIYASCLWSARRAPGFFTLTVPTGGGKTLSGMGFALRHALRHGKRRIVVAVPFTTVTDQTAAVYRRVFENESGPVVLEHHSAADWRSGEADEHETSWASLIAENWDAPIVVTTTVQLFDSLFARTPEKMRKLHRLANSVIVLDEAQSLPRHLLTPILSALRDLVECYGATVVFSTATQPAFEAIPAFRGSSGDAPAREIAAEPDRLFERLRRVSYEQHGPTGWDGAVALMAKAPRGQALAIVNTRRDALDLYSAAGRAGAEGLFHLSTLMCQAHRLDVLAEVLKRLNAGAACTLVSTQIVEAGVDVDFPLVLRAAGPLDAVAQAAGRCNRHGLLPGGGKVIVFEPEDAAPLPRDYRRAANAGGRILRTLEPDEHPDSPAVLTRYFREIHEGNLDARDIEPARVRLDFPGVAREFRMIEPRDECVVEYPGPHAQERQKRMRDALGSLRSLRDSGSAGLPLRTAMQALQPFLATLPGSMVRDGDKRLEPLADRLWVWSGDYGDCGIALDE